MGRGDGRGRIVSPDGADDSGTRILHVDMDAFYAAVEILDDPSLHGLPLIIGAPDGRSVVSSASYEARRYGVRAAMPVGQAMRLCPTAKIVTPHFDRYQAVSKQVMAVFESITPLVEPLSVDEAFLDVQGVRRLWGSPGRIAQLVRERVHAEVGITCSVGVAATKHVAKMASTISKPDGLLIVAASDTLDFLAPRSVRAMWGVGPKASEALEARGIRTIGDIRDSPQEMLDRAVGPTLGARIAQLARGEGDARTVETERVEKSVGHEETFDVDIVDREFLRAELLRLSDRVAVRLRSCRMGVRHGRDQDPLRRLHDREPFAGSRRTDVPSGNGSAQRRRACTSRSTDATRYGWSGACREAPARWQFSFRAVGRRRTLAQGRGGAR